MSLNSMIVSNHLNKIKAGKPLVLSFPLPLDEAQSTQVSCQKLAITMVCIGFGLARFDELLNSD